jgi:hypothetical protein
MSSYRLATWPCKPASHAHGWRSSKEGVHFLQQLQVFTSWLATIDDVRTLMESRDEEFAKVLENIRTIKSRMEAWEQAA